MHIKHLGTLPDSETGELTQVGVDQDTGLLVAFPSEASIKRALKVVDTAIQDTVDDMHRG